MKNLTTQGSNLIKDIIHRPILFLLVSFAVFIGGFLSAVIFTPLGAPVNGSFIVVLSFVVWGFVMLGYDGAKYDDVVSILTMILTYIALLLILIGGYWIYVLI